MDYDHVSGLFSWNIAWSGLTGTETVMHFHGPAIPAAAWLFGSALLGLMGIARRKRA